MGNVPVFAKTNVTHSRFSASGAERWTNCPGSVSLCENLPDVSSPWAKEGTEAHAVLETVLKSIQKGYGAPTTLVKTVPFEMLSHAIRASRAIREIWHEEETLSELHVETKTHLPFIHPEMFGTYDAAVFHHFKTLHVFDYKYGAGHAVSPLKNLQMVIYGLGASHLMDWNFRKVRLWIIQPRIRGYDGPVFWELTMVQLKRYIDFFRRAVERVESKPKHYVEGSWCHWCKGKAICPLKQKQKKEKIKTIFSPISKERA